MSKEPSGKEVFSTILHDTSSLHHQVSGLEGDQNYSGVLQALVGPHLWAYKLLNFSLTTPSILSGPEAFSMHKNLSSSNISDLERVTMEVSLRWSLFPFKTDGICPTKYTLTIWSNQQVVRKETFTPLGTSSDLRDDEFVETDIGGLPLDKLYKVTLEGKDVDDGVPKTILTFSLLTGSLVAGQGVFSIGGVEGCFSALQVRCPNSERCVSPYWICDGSEDCPDGADEKACYEKRPCKHGFTCWGSTQCLPASWKCDGFEDCKDGEDELGCGNCGGDDLLRCGTGSDCVSVGYACDGQRQCPDGWDETDSVCNYITQKIETQELLYNFKCPEGQVSCGLNGGCVAITSVCNGISDCIGSEDEMPLFCAIFKNNIFHTKILTPDQEYVPTSQLTPELHYETTQPPTNTILSSVRNLTFAIKSEPMSSLSSPATDKVEAEFKFFTEEHIQTITKNDSSSVNSPKFAPATSTAATTTNFKSTRTTTPSSSTSTTSPPRSFKSTTFASSLIFESIPEITSECRNDEFDCGDGWCVPVFWLCDGRFDCLNGEDEDERACKAVSEGTQDALVEKESIVENSIPDSSKKFQCPEGHLRCSSGKCVERARLCDGVNDCPEHEDELSCNILIITSNQGLSNTEQGFHPSKASALDEKTSAVIILEGDGITKEFGTMGDAVDSTTPFAWTKNMNPSISTITTQPTTHASSNPGTSPQSPITHSASSKTSTAESFTDRTKPTVTELTNTSFIDGNIFLSVKSLENNFQMDSENMNETTITTEDNSFPWNSIINQNKADTESDHENYSNNSSNTFWSSNNRTMHTNDSTNDTNDSLLNQEEFKFYSDSNDTILHNNGFDNSSDSLIDKFNSLHASEQGNSTNIYLRGNSTPFYETTSDSLSEDELQVNLSSNYTFSTADSVIVIDITSQSEDVTATSTNDRLSSLSLLAEEERKQAERNGENDINLQITESREHERNDSFMYFNISENESELSDSSFSINHENDWEGMWKENNLSSTIGREKINISSLENYVYPIQNSTITSAFSDTNSVGNDLLSSSQNLDLEIDKTNVTFSISGVTNDEGFLVLSNTSNGRALSGDSTVFIAVKVPVSNESIPKFIVHSESGKRFDYEVVQIVHRPLRTLNKSEHSEISNDGFHLEKVITFRLESNGKLNLNPDAMRLQNHKVRYWELQSPPTTSLPVHANSDTTATMNPQNDSAMFMKLEEETITTPLIMSEENSLENTSNISTFYPSPESRDVTPESRIEPSVTLFDTDSEITNSEVEDVIPPTNPELVSDNDYPTPTLFDYPDEWLGKGADFVDKRYSPDVSNVIEDHFEGASFGKVGHKRNDASFHHRKSNSIKLRKKMDPIETNYEQENDLNNLGDFAESNYIDPYPMDRTTHKFIRTAKLLEASSAQDSWKRFSWLPCMLSLLLYLVFVL